MRGPRERSESGVYHIVLRGINRQDIFYNNDDYQRFIATVQQMKAEEQFSVYGFCLMMNHVHLLIRENTDSISRIMSRIGTSYEPGMVLKIFHEEPEKAMAGFMEQDNDDKCLEDEAKQRKTDNEVKAEIEKLMNGEPIGGLQALERTKRNEILRKVKQTDGVSLRQIARVTGISVDIIFNS